MSIKPALCRHGNLARSCPICEEIADAQIRLDERRKIIDEKDAEIARLKAVARAYEHYVMTGRDEQHERLVAERDALKAEVERLKEWIREESDRSDICTYNVLREVCTGCYCGRAR